LRPGGYAIGRDRHHRRTAFMRLTAEALTAVRGGRTVFSGLSFTAGAGELVAVVGPNGSGKSTLLRILAGLLRAPSGKVSADPATDFGEAVHYLGHLDALKAPLSVRANLEFWKRLWNGVAVDTALDAVDLVDLADLPAGVLSAGQRRRVAIARLLIAKRPIWLLDEPLTALDASSEKKLGRLLGEHLASNGIAIVATHRDLPLRPAATIELGAP
jgi:heme exporter protein A